MNSPHKKTLIQMAVEDSHLKLQQSIRALLNTMFSEFLNGLAVDNRLVYGCIKDEPARYVEYAMGNAKVLPTGDASEADTEVYIIVQYDDVRFSATRVGVNCEVNLGDMRTPSTAIDLKEWLDGLTITFTNPEIIPKSA